MYAVKDEAHGSFLSKTCKHWSVIIKISDTVNFGKSHQEQYEIVKFPKYNIKNHMPTLQQNDKIHVTHL